MFQEMTGDRPMVGLWEKDRHFGLLWQRSDNITTYPLPPPLSHIPSWSWMSVDVPIRAPMGRGYGPTHTRHDEQGGAVVFLQPIRWSDQPLISTIIEAKIVVSGHCAQFTAQQAGNATSFSNRFELRQHQVLPNGTVQRGSTSVGWCTFDSYPPSRDHPFYALGVVLIQQNWHGRAQQHSFYSYSAILLQQTGSTGNVFQRIGAGYFDNEQIDFETWPRITAEIV
jgi:hypothetical protein